MNGPSILGLSFTLCVLGLSDVKEIGGLELGVGSDRSFFDQDRDQLGPIRRFHGILGEIGRLQSMRMRNGGDTQNRRLPRRLGLLSVTSTTRVRRTRGA